MLCGKSNSTGHRFACPAHSDPPGLMAVSWHCLIDNWQTPFNHLKKKKTQQHRQQKQAFFSSRELFAVVILHSILHFGLVSTCPHGLRLAPAWRCFVYISKLTYWLDSAQCLQE